MYCKFYILVTLRCYLNCLFNKTLLQYFLLDVNSSGLYINKHFPFCQNIRKFIIEGKGDELREPVTKEEILAEVRIYSLTIKIQGGA